MLRKTGRQAAVLPPLGRHPSDLPFQRHQRDDGAHYGVAEDGTTTGFTDEDVAILEVNPREFCSRIAVALELTPAPEPEGEGIDAYLVTTYSYRGLPCPIFLVLAAEEDHFDAAVASVCSGTVPAVILTPTTRRLSRILRNSIASRGVAVVAMSDIFVVTDRGVLVCTRPVTQLLPSAASRAAGESLPHDGVRDRTCIVVNGVEHRCDLTEREVKFLRAAWDRDEIPLVEMVHPRNGLISKKRFNNSRQHRNLVSRFLKELNPKLQLDAKPPLRLGFALPVRSDSVVRDRIE